MAGPFKMKGLSPLKHPKHKDHHDPKTTKKSIKASSSPGWPKLKKK